MTLGRLILTVMLWTTAIGLLAIGTMVHSHAAFHIAVISALGAATFTIDSLCREALTRASHENAQRTADAVGVAVALALQEQSVGVTRRGISDATPPERV